MCYSQHFTRHMCTQMILEAGENWEEEVLPEMRNDLATLLDDSSGGAGGNGLQDGIIVTSLKSITVGRQVMIQ